MYRLVLTSFDVAPTKDDYYMVVYKKEYRYSTDNYAYEYHTDGGWNTVRNFDGTIFADSTISVERMKEQFEGWLRPVYYGEEKWADTIATILDEVATEKNATEPTEGEEIGRYEMLDELQEYLMKALDFAEGVDRC